MRPEYATVVDVIQGKGVKIKKDGEKEALDIYYNNLGAVNVGDKVYIKYTSGSILVVGKVHSGNTDTGGGSSTGVTKEYVDTQDAELSRQINDLFGETIEIGFGKRCKPTTVSSYKDLPNGRWFGTIPDAPVEGVCYYDVYLGDNQVYKRVECKSWLNDTIYFNQNINGAWGEWQQIATTAKTDISFPFTGSYMSRGGYVSKVTKDAMGLVTINVTFQINDGSTLLPQGNNIIGTLPVGYRPQGIVAGVGSTAFGGTMVNVRVTVGSDGVVTCNTGNGYTGSNVIGFSISYYV